MKQWVITFLVFFTVLTCSRENYGEIVNLEKGKYINTELGVIFNHFPKDVTLYIIEDKNYGNIELTFVKSGKKLAEFYISRHTSMGDQSYEKGILIDGEYASMTEGLEYTNIKLDSDDPVQLHFQSRKTSLGTICNFYLDRSMVPWVQKNFKFIRDEEKIKLMENL
ncbi:MAG: hypothetical protein OEZ34_06895 [Spirochaetia bacterium]|nr:hypothetical protein [Spirochaetia bacterium]